MAGSPDVLAGTFAGRYTIERELGSGATATVYLARDTQRGIAVAVKLLRQELSQSVGADRFLREIRLNEKLHHPHIVPVLDSGEHDGRLYFVLPHMEDGSLRQLLQREKQLPIERAIEITKTVAQALDYAHRQNLIHRDVKPENILFTAGQACLADFGIARAVERAIDESTTDTGLVRGTPAYMSPEQASGSKHYDGRSDQYSLACVLYEMLAGVPAFIGPTPEAVIAQRFQHLPRELRVYRPSVPESIEGVIQKALSMAPADRFASTSEFCQALDSLPRARTDEGPASKLRPNAIAVGKSKRRPIIAVSTIAAAMLIVLVGPSVGARVLGRTAPADTLRYAILPIESDSGVATGEAYERLHTAFSRWSGIEVAHQFDVREALGSDSPVRNDAEARAAARELRAGRYVRARIARAGVGFTLNVALSDVVSGMRLTEFNSAFTQPDTAVYDRAATALLLRTAEQPGPISPVLAATQLFLRGMAEQRAFRLNLADSLLSEAVERDRSFARASFWLAQVRAWRFGASGRENWAPWAERAAVSTRLLPIEQQLARALVALGREQYRDACSAYRTMTEAQPRFFEAWYGLGQCLDFDRTIVRDQRTTSGWRFRSSYHQAVRAYGRAFELAPATHRNFEPRAFSQLRRLLYAGRALGRPGTALAPDTTRFVAYPEWEGDSLVFVPYPTSLVRAGAVPLDHQRRSRATTEQVRLFNRIARSWSAAFPRNASAKEAVAVAMELAGDASALDTLQLARELAESGDQRLRLAAEEVLFRTSLARQRPEVLPAAVRLADSILNAASRPSREEAQVLAPLAALRGRCRLAAQLGAIAASRGFGDHADLPVSVFASADSLSILVAMGCDSISHRAVTDIIALTPATLRTDSTSMARLEYSLFARAYAIAGLRDTLRLGRLSKVSGDYLLRGQYDLARGDHHAARRMLEQRERQRGRAGTTDVTPDAVFPETTLWLALGDTATAASWPDPMLARTSWLEHLLNDPYAAASLLRTAVLRADIARASSRPDEAARWMQFVRTLWSDSELSAVPKRFE